ncbi:transposase [Streptomyces sp. NPDC023723]|uniref:transposase n=1 Tax=Streptomyces sp. NPDC023723 TaxID=3154323 RepID=UPI0033D9CF09
MKMDDPAPVAPRVAAVDDFALRRSRRYGPLLVDADSRLPIDVWDTQEAESLTAWLRAHPGIEVVCRDGSVTYRGAITAGAPDALRSAAASTSGRDSAAKSTGWQRPIAPVCPNPPPPHRRPRYRAGWPLPARAVSTPRCTILRGATGVR